MIVGRGRVLTGVTLIGLGVLFALARVTDLEPSEWWPVIVVAVGVGTLLVRGPARVGMLISGTQFVALGFILLFQTQTGLWSTWAYAWTLIWPTSVGLGMIASGGSLARHGRRLLWIGIALFLVGFAFFEGVVDLSGKDLGVVGDVAVPAVLIVAGVLLLAPVFSRSKRSAPS